MLKSDLIVNHIYAAKRPSSVGLFGYYNDRQILWMGELSVQYDSPTVKDGRPYPKVSIENFLKWAGEDITKIMPVGAWREKK